MRPRLPSPIARLARRQLILAVLRKADDEAALVILLRKLQALYRTIGDTALQRLLQISIEEIEAAGTAAAALAAVRALDLGQLALANLPQTELAELNELIYRVGAEAVAPRFSLGLPDRRALDLIGQQNLFWLGEHYNEAVAGDLEPLLRQAFEEGWSRVRLAEALGAKFKDLRVDEQAYYSDLADHTVRKLRELGRIAGYERAGIEYVKVKAILDRRTSLICRCLHGRLIAVKRLVEQRQAILTAAGKDELKAAQAWITDFHGPTDELPQGVAGPPYHYKCRTITVAYFPNVSEVGRKLQWADDQGNVRYDKILFSHVDEKWGREFVLTEKGLQHADRDRHPIPRAKVEAALRSIQSVGVGQPLGAEGETVTLSQNNVVLIMRGNIVYTAIPFPNAKAAADYFKRTTATRTRKNDDANDHG